jgi:hypothetical protein
MKLTKSKLRQIIKEEIGNLTKGKSLNESFSPHTEYLKDYLTGVGVISEDPDIADPMGGEAVLPGRVRAAQQSLDSLASAVPAMSDITKQALSQLVNALNDQNYNVQFPSGQVRNI